MSFLSFAWKSRPPRLVGTVAPALAALCLAALSTGATAADRLVLGRQVEDTLLSAISERVVREACRRAGIELELRRLPLLRSIESANEGDIDGNLHRIADVAHDYPNLVPVPTPVNRIDVAIYGATPAVQGWTRSQIEGLRIGYPRGTFALAKYSRGLHATEALDRRVVVEMLHDGRFDVAMVPYLDLEGERAAGRLPGLYLWPTAWASEPLHLVLNRRHASQASRLEAVLARMQREGTIESLRQDALRGAHIEPLRPPAPAVAR